MVPEGKEPFPFVEVRHSDHLLDRRLIAKEPVQIGLFHSWIKGVTPVLLRTAITLGPSLPEWNLPSDLS